jgi:hypothetical protein
MSGREPFDPANRMRPVLPATRDTAFGSPSPTPSSISTPNAKKDLSPGSEKTEMASTSVSRRKSQPTNTIRHERHDENCHGR